MPQLRQFVYVSTATQLMDRDQLTELLVVSRRNNETADVTGIMLYVEGAFMQALEGAEAMIDATMARIQRDPRHAGITTLADHPVEAREFGDWAMALAELTRAEAQNISGMSDFLQLPAAELKRDLSPVQCLLEGFKRSHSRYLHDS